MDIQGTTRVLGVFGDPVAHSLSPAMHNEALAQAGMDAVYLPFHVTSERLGEAVAGLRALNIQGVNVTVPHKEAVCYFLDEIDPRARLIGAVNTISCCRERLLGYNTDWIGFLRALEEDLHFSPENKRILLLGAGGACRAALVGLATQGASWIGVANRTPSRAKELIEKFSGEFSGTSFALRDLESEALSRVFPEIDLLVNTSSVGLQGEAFPELPWGSLPQSTCIYDMVYAPQDTPFVATARQRGNRAADGRSMLVGQGEEAFFLWTGQRPPKGVMRRRLTAELTRRQGSA